MTPPNEGGADFAPLLRKLQRHVVLDTTERQNLLAAFETPRVHPKGALLLGEGHGENSVGVLLEGLAYSFRASASGRSQAVALHMGGDTMNLEGFLSGPDYLTTSALTTVRTCTISHGRLRRLIQDHPALGLAFWGAMAVDMRIAQEWLFGLGQRSALQNVAHLICEVRARREPGSIRPGGGIGFPMTQEQFGNTLGLSVVHVNRTLQQLKNLGLTRHTRSTLTILNPEGLRALAKFDGAYLHSEPSALLRPQEEGARKPFSDGNGERVEAG